MELKPSLSALVTGGASGIGGVKALSLALRGKGIFVTVVDFSEERGREVAKLVEKENAKFHSELEFTSAIFVKCDVTNARDLAAAFEKHLATYEGLDICINSAGIVTQVPFRKDVHTWRHTIEVNLMAVFECTRIATRIMQSLEKPGVIITLGSSSGLYPMTMDPIYAGSKGGVVMFTRSLSPLKREGIRINVLCPEFVETETGTLEGAKLVAFLDGYVPMDMVVKGAFQLISDESKGDSCLWSTNRRGMEYWPNPAEKAKYIIPKTSLQKKYSSTVPVKIHLPESLER